MITTAPFCLPSFARSRLRDRGYAHLKGGIDGHVDVARTFEDLLDRGIIGFIAMPYQRNQCSVIALETRGDLARLRIVALFQFGDIVIAL